MNLPPRILCHLLVFALFSCGHLGANVASGFVNNSDSGGSCSNSAFQASNTPGTLSISISCSTSNTSSAVNASFGTYSAFVDVQAAVGNGGGDAVASGIAGFNSGELLFSNPLPSLFSLWAVYESGLSGVFSMVNFGAGTEVGLANCPSVQISVLFNALHCFEIINPNQITGIAGFMQLKDGIDGPSNGPIEATASIAFVTFGDQNQNVVGFTVIPEPSALTITLGGGIILTVLKRKHRRGIW